jgi:hypothetical protein
VGASVALLALAFSSFQPGPQAQAATPDGWRGQQVELIVAAPVSASAQQFGGNVAPPARSSPWCLNDFQRVINAPFQPGTQQFSAFEPQGFIAPFVPEGWRGQQLEYRFAPPLPTAEQQFNSFEPLGFVASIFPDGWRAAQYEYQFAKPVAASGQQYSAHVAESVLGALGVEGWYGQQLEYRVVASFPVGDQQFQTFTIGSVPTAATPNGWQRYQFDYRYVAPFPVASQQFLTDIAGPFSSVIASAPHGWESWQFAEYKFATPLPAASQQYAAFQPRGFVASTFPDGWRHAEWDYGVAKPFPVGAQLFLAQVPEPFAGAVAPQGWEGAQLDYRYATPLAAAQQQYAAHIVERVPQAVNVQGWHGQQLDYRFALPVSAAQQDFSRGMPQPVIAGATAKYGWFSDLAVAKVTPFTVTGDFAIGWTATQIVPAAPKQGGHGEWPPYRGETPKKPVRPIWDRGAAEVEAAAEAAPIEPAAATPAPKRPVSDLTGLARSLIPAVVPAPTSPQAITIKPRRAAASVTDADISGKRTVGTIASAKILEDSDTVSAKASWNDDDLLLAMILSQTDDE